MPFDMSDMECNNTQFRMEMDRALMDSDPYLAIQKVCDSGSLKLHAPEVFTMVGFGGIEEGHKDLWSHVRQVVAQTPMDVLMRWAALFHDVGKVSTFRRNGPEVSFHGHEAVSARMFRQFAKRTGIFTQEEYELIDYLVSNLGLVEGYQSDWTDSAVRRLSKEVGDGLDYIISLAKADVTTKHAHKRDKYRAKLDELQKRAREIATADAIPQALPKGLGEAIMSEFKIAPGRELGQMMKRLKDEVESGSLPRNSDFEVYLARLRVKNV